MDIAGEMTGLKSAIKLLLKQKGVHYSDLAEHLQTSIPTIKRCLSQEELSLSRLLSICVYLGVSLAELDAVAKDQANAKHEFFTEEQELFFVSEPRYLTYLVNLYDGETPADIAKRYKLSAASTEKYLRKLEQMGLIKVSPKGRVKPSSITPPEWITNGPLMNANLEMLVDRFSGFFKGPVIDRLRKGTLARGTRLTLFTTRVSKKYYLNWREQMGKLLDEIKKTSDYECKFMDPKELETAVVMGAFSLLPANDPEIETLGNVLGRIGDL